MGYHILNLMDVIGITEAFCELDPPRPEWKCQIRPININRESKQFLIIA